jgi:hypothetical protein
LIVTHAFNSSSALLRQAAAKCKDPKTAHELLTLSNQLKNQSVQLKILCSVKASSGGGRDSDKALISMSQRNVSLCCCCWLFVVCLLFVAVAMLNANSHLFAEIQQGLKGAPAAVLKALLAS